MSVQNFTKSLRDKSIPILDRKTSALEVIDGSTPLNLPQKPVVILEWIFSALSTEPTARESAQFWDFLGLVWTKCDVDSQSKIARSFKLPNILLDAWKQDLSSDTMDAIDTTMQLVLSTTMLNCNSDAQAGSLILGYCKRLHGRETNILPVYQKQLISRSKIFKKMPKVLETICGIPNNQDLLIDYFSSRDADPSCPEPALAEVMTAIISSNVQVGERFVQLATKFPKSAHKLLKSLGVTKLPNERETLKSLIDKQISLYNWDSLSILLERIPVETVAKLNELFDALDSQFDQQFAIALMQKCAQTRKLGEFATKWSKTKQKHWFSPEITAAMAAVLEQLSQVQLVELLKSLHQNGYLYVLPKLSYKAVTSPALRTNLLELLELKDRVISFSILSLWPSITGEHPEVVKSIEKLKSTECSLLLLERGLNISYPTYKPEDPCALVSRFYRVLKTPTKIIGSLDQEQTAQLLKLKDIWEYPSISEEIINHFIAKKYDTRLFMDPPLQALSKKHKEGLLNVAWAQKNLQFVDYILKSPPRSTDVESNPKLLAKMASSLNESECRVLMDVATKLSRHESYAQKLSGIVTPDKSWQQMCLAVAAAGSSGNAALVPLLEESLGQQKHTKSSVLCLEQLVKSGVATNPTVLGSLIHQGDEEDDREVFGLLCQSTKDWQAITACFIYTGCQYLGPFLAFVEALEPEKVVLLIRECIKGKYYKAIQALFSSGELVKEEVIPFVTLMVQTVFTMPEELTEVQAVEYLSLATHLVRENSWVLTQYALETLIMTIVKLTSRQFNASIEQPVELFSDMCLFLSQALLFQRHRLNNRNHLVIAALSGLLRCLSGSKLTAEQREKVGNFPHFVASQKLGKSVVAAESLLRVVTIFCDPPQRSVRENSGKNNLTSSVARIRRYVAKTAGVLVSNYATISLQYGFSSAISSVMNRVIFTVLVVLGTQELKGTMASMDNASRAYMKSVYDNYLATGKYRKD